MKYDCISTVEGHYNAITNTSLYEGKYHDGKTEQLTSNIIYENLLSQLDSEVHHYQVLAKVNYHNICDTDITQVDSFIKSSNGNLQHKRTTCSCKILVEWKDDSADWVPLKDLKQSNPVELGEYAMKNEISDGTEFRLWVKYTLRRKDIIINKVNYKYWLTTHTFGIRVPKTVKIHMILKGNQKLTFGPRQL